MAQRPSLPRWLAVVLTLALMLPATVLGAAPAGSSGQGTERVIVVLNATAGDPGAVGEEMSRRHNGRLGFVYRHALRGFALELPAPAVAAITRDSRVAYVEADQQVHIFQQESPTGIRRIFADSNSTIDIDSTDDQRVDVDVAVIDTGIDLDHPDLSVVGSINCAQGGPFGGSCSGSGEDGNGHGTHVAGTIGALDNSTGVVGVAPGARLWAVRVLDNNGSGYMSWIAAGIDWVTARADQIEVANMSLGCECTSQVMDDAITNSVKAGVVYAVAAGNSDKDSATFSPANHPDVITVSALADFNGVAGGGGADTCRWDVDDTLADFSNFGSSVEIAAPGVCINSTWLNGGYNTISGTSMASPHAAGAAALLASQNNPGNKTDVQNIRSTLISYGNLNWTDDSGDGIKERLLDVSNSTVFAPVLVAGSSGGGSTDNPPTVSITSPTSSTTVSGTITIAAEASDDNGIAQMEFLVDGSPIGTDTSSPYEMNWDTTSAANGSHTLTARATDSIGQTTTSTGVSVTVDNSTDSGSAFTLSASGYKVKGVQKADLSWSGATSTSVDVYRSGSKIMTTANDGAYTDNINQKGGGSYTYRICEVDSTTCSNEVTISF